jgi:hypothetical protein
VVHPGKAPEHRYELAVFALGNLQIDDVVVEVVFPVSGRDRLQLAAGRVNQDRLQGPDLRGDVNGHTTNYSES